MPVSSPSGISRVRPPRKPTTSVGTRGRSRPSPTRQISPISTWRPVASMIRPIRSRTRPRRRARSSSCMTRATRPRAGRAKVSDLILGHSVRGPSSAATTSRARASCVSIEASISPSSVRASTPPRPTRRSDWTLRCSIPPSSDCSRVTASDISSRSAGLTTSVTCWRSRMRRSATAAMSTMRSGSTSMAPATICSARRSARATASCSSSAMTWSRAASSAWAAPPTACSEGSISARAAARPAARPSASPAARACWRICSASA